MNIQKFREIEAKLKQLEARVALLESPKLGESVAASAGSLVDKTRSVLGLKGKQ